MSEIDVNEIDMLRESGYDFTIGSANGAYQFELLKEGKLIVASNNKSLQDAVKHALVYAKGNPLEVAEPRPGLYTISRASIYGKPCDEAFKLRVGHGFREEWFVQVDDLLAFIEKYGKCVVKKDDNGFWDIEIYDSYIE